MPLPTNRLNEWRNARRHWPRLVSEIAALIIITALVGSVVLIFTLRPHAPAHNGPLPSNPNGQIQQIHMIDANVGWAVVQTKHGNSVDPASAIMRTTDGGKTWYDVTPPEPYNISAGPLLNGTPAPSPDKGVIVEAAAFQTDFLSGNDAWVALIPSAGNTPLSFTQDGGQTWHESSIPVNNIKQMSFIDAQHGWVLTDTTQSGMPDTEGVILYQTVDGGKIWMKLSETTSRPLSDTTSGALPLTGSKTGFTFINAQTGWMVGQTQQANFFWFYITHDGGRTWQHQSLPNPSIPNSPTGAEPQFQLQPPVFFGNDGVLSFTITTDGTASLDIIEFYMTHNGGISWQSTSSPVSLVNLTSHTFEAPQFVDATHGRLAIDNAIMFLHRSGNSNNWGEASNIFYGKVLQSTFVTDSTGWVIVDNAHPNSYLVNSNDPWLLYHTTDGGKAWTQINYLVMGQQVQTSQKLNKGWTAVANYSDMGSKVMFLHGRIVPSKQWGAVYTFSCTKSGSFKATLFDTNALSNMANGGSIPGNSLTSHCPVQASTPSYLTDTYQSPSMEAGVQVQADSSAKWSFLVVECTNTQGCSDSPLMQ